MQPDSPSALGTPKLQNPLRHLRRGVPSRLPGYGHVAVPADPLDSAPRQYRVQIPVLNMHDSWGALLASGPFSPELAYYLIRIAITNLSLALTQMLTLVLLHTLIAHMNGWRAMLWFLLGKNLPVPAQTALWTGTRNTVH